MTTQVSHGMRRSIKSFRTLFIDIFILILCVFLFSPLSAQSHSHCFHTHIGAMCPWAGRRAESSSLAPALGHIPVGK